MSEMLSVLLLHQWGGHKAGDVVDVDAASAWRLAGEGFGRPAEHYPPTKEASAGVPE